MMDVALNILALIAGGLTLELFASSGSPKLNEQTTGALADVRVGEELLVCNPS
jgi:hypothetical protein